MPHREEVADEQQGKEQCYPVGHGECQGDKRGGNHPDTAAESGLGSPGEDHGKADQKPERG